MRSGLSVTAVLAPDLPGTATPDRPGNAERRDIKSLSAKCKPRMADCTSRASEGRRIIQDSASSPVSESGVEREA